MEKIEHIHEQIIVIAFNSSRAEDFHVKNISSNTILQVCENESNCQPKLENQKYSCKFYFKVFPDCYFFLNKYVFWLGVCQKS